MTRALILAAGTGSRLRPLTDSRPKALVPLLGPSLLDRQRRVLQAANISADHTALVTGYQSQAFAGSGLREFPNPRFADTNMVASLACARAWFDGQDDVLVAYGDIVYEPAVLSAVLAGEGSVVVAVDRGWHALWSLRMDDPLADAETMRVDPSGRILALGGRPTCLEEIQGQYIGLFKVARSFAAQFLRAYDQWPAEDGVAAAARERMFMTSYLQWQIDQGVDVRAADIHHGWVEVDTVEDLRRYEAAAADGRLDALYAWRT